jgi:hypothetical protein
MVRNVVTSIPSSTRGRGHPPPRPAWITRQAKGSSGRSSYSSIARRQSLTRAAWALTAPADTYGRGGLRARQIRRNTAAPLPIAAERAVCSVLPGPPIAASSPACSPRHWAAPAAAWGMAVGHCAVPQHRDLLITDWRRSGSALLVSRSRHHARCLAMKQSCTTSSAVATS